MIIGEHSIGNGSAPFIVAELSGNHNGSLERMLKLMEAVKEAGADAIKIQTYTADTLTIDNQGPDFTIRGGLWDGRTLYDLYREAHTPWEWHAALFDKAKSLGIPIFSSPFDATAIDLLEELGNPFYKVASFEMIDLPLIERIAQTGKPMIISTGMANEIEIEEAVTCARTAGCQDIVLLHCVSSYPAPAEETNLKTMVNMADRFGVVAGLSDHTLGTAVAVAATVLGAAVIEKHITLDRNDGGPDAAFSLEPHELKQLCDDCRTASLALGNISYTRAPAEQGSLVFRRSLYVVEDIASGSLITEENVRSIRPGHGLAPKHLPDVIGLKAQRDLKRGDRLAWDMVREKKPSS